MEQIVTGSGQLERLIRQRKRMPFVDATGRAEPRILQLLPGDGSFFDTQQKEKFRGSTDFTPLFEAASVSLAWIFPDTKTEEILAGIKARRPQAIVNTILDPEIHPEALRVAARICEHFPVVINAPDRVLLQTRDRVSQSLQGIAGLSVPACIRLPKGSTDWPDLEFPVIVRKAGTFLSESMQLVQDRATAHQVLTENVDADMFVIAFYDYRSPDGWYRSYRTFMVGGVPIPYHMQFSESWLCGGAGTMKLMAKYPWMADEEAMFLKNPVPAPHAQIFEEVTRRIGSDIYAVDYAMKSDGTILLFEANAFQPIVRPPWRSVYPASGEASRRLIRAARMLLARKILGTSVSRR